MSKEPASTQEKHRNLVKCHFTIRKKIELLVFWPHSVKVKYVIGLYYSSCCWKQMSTFWSSTFFGGPLNFTLQILIFQVLKYFYLHFWLKIKCTILILKIPPLLQVFIRCHFTPLSITILDFKGIFYTIVRDNWYSMACLFIKSL